MPHRVTKKKPATARISRSAFQRTGAMKLMIERSSAVPSGVFSTRAAATSTKTVSALSSSKSGQSTFSRPTG